MKVRDLIAALDELAHDDKDAEVFFGPEEGDPIRVEGGILMRRSEGTVLLLAPLKLDAQPDGF
jgi:hypothetical protein